MAHVPLEPIGSPRAAFLSDAAFAANLEQMRPREQTLRERRERVAQGWGAKYVERVHKKGKLTARERIDRLADEGAPRLPVGTFVNHGEIFGGKLESPGAGLVTVFTKVSGRWVMIIANDNTVASGSWWPRSPEKIERAQEMALRMRVPVIYLVDCSGLFLPEQSRTFSGATGAGHIFKRNAQLSAQGVPQIAGVFGDCIAGGGYMPIISDRVIMTEQAYMVIAGAALLKGAKSQKITSLDIGGPEVHVHQSGCADVRVPDDEAALAWIRDEVERLPLPAAPYYRAGAQPMAPTFPPAELAGIVPADHRHGYDGRQVLARLVDGSLFWELWPRRGPEVIVGVGRVHGLYMGFAITQPDLVPTPEDPTRKRPGGILYRDGIAKLSQFARACDADGIPLVWLQDISGFDIGADAEREGLLGYGSSLIFANSVQRSPVFTILLRRASGAGYYAMSGRPYDPVIQLSTPVSRLSVMEGRTLAIATYNTKLDDDFEVATDDPDERQAILDGMAEVEARIEQDMDPYVSARQLDTDELVSLPELRDWLEGLAEIAYTTVGYRKVKNPRIWSLHDLAALEEEAPIPAEELTCSVRDEGDARLLCSPAVGDLRPLLAAGMLVGPGTPVARLTRLGRPRTLVAPAGLVGRVEQVLRSAHAEYGQPLVRVSVLGDLSQVSEAVSATPGADLVVRAPQTGRFYHRPAPDQPVYVSAGAALEPGTTLGLIEVMKTFFQVRYQDPDTGEGLPDAAIVVAFLVPDGGEVEQGQPLLEVRHP